MNISIRSPKSQSDFQQRSLLLQSSLRQPQDPFRIESEYPIVLSEESACFSLCAFMDQQMLAHLNFWPRTLLTPSQSYSVALIGNVATRADMREKGLIRTLLAETERLAVEQKIAGLFLWSDLNQFYQKLGFTSASRELRLHFTTETLKQQNPKTEPRKPTLAKALKTSDFKQFLSLRPKPHATLDRSPQEFEALVRIPDTFLFTNSQKNAFCIAGRGVDMRGVIHEWGTTNAEALCDLIISVGVCLGLEEVILLAAETMTSAPWFDDLCKHAKHREFHDMALSKMLQSNHGLAQAMQQSFIWGLDSI